jgi:hypothetical protein
MVPPVSQDPQGHENISEFFDSNNAIVPPVEEVNKLFGRRVVGASAKQEKYRPKGKGSPLKRAMVEQMSDEEEEEEETTVLEKLSKLKYLCISCVIS